MLTFDRIRPLTYTVANLINKLKWHLTLLNKSSLPLTDPREAVPQAHGVVHIQGGLKK